MKKYTFMLLILTIILTLWPFFEFFLYQWRNDARLPLSNGNYTVNIASSGGQTIFKVYNMTADIASLSDYIIASNADLLAANAENYNVIGLTDKFMRLGYRVKSYINGSAVSGYQLKNLLLYSCCMNRFISVLLATTSVWIMTLPIFLVDGLFSNFKKVNKK